MSNQEDIRLPQFTSKYSPRDFISGSYYGKSPVVIILNSLKTEKVLYLTKVSFVVFYPVETIFCSGKVVDYIRAIFCWIEFFTQCRGTYRKLVTEQIVSMFLMFVFEI